ncbi:MAG: polysaccharide biosynthesis protein, partial [Anaerolineae bacterium]|nr:polysaccharide biosynthesis protein [Anaerolineae bacterium]
RYRREIKRIALIASLDAAILLAAYTLTYMVRIEPTDETFEVTTRSVSFLTGAVIVHLIALYAAGAYHRIWRRTSGHDVIVLIRGIAASSVVIALAALPLKPRPVPLSVVGFGGLLALMGSATIRYRSRLISGTIWRWRAVWYGQFPPTLTRVLLVGAGEAGQVVAWRLKHRAPQGTYYRVIGFVDDDPAKQMMYVEGVQVLGTRAAIPRLTEEYNVDLIVVAIHNIDGPAFREILGLCQQTSARIKRMPDIFALFNDLQSAPLRDIQPEDLLGRATVSWHEGVDVTPVSGKVVLVTGAAGSIGSELCRQLLKYEPVRLLMLDNNESGLHDLVIELHTPENEGRLTACLVDITNRPALKKIFEAHHPQVIFHSAAYKHVPMMEDYPDEALRINVGGTQQVSGLARDFKAERFVLISTDKAVNPSSVMGASKRVCELLMHAIAQQDGHETLFTSVRFGNVLGSRGSVVPTFTRQIDNGGPITITHPDMTRYFMTIPEAANLVVHAACLTHGDDLFMLRMGQVVRILDLAERMIRLRGLRPRQDIPIEFTGTRPGEKLHEQLHTDGETLRPTPHPDIVELVSNHDGWQPVAFSDQIHTLFQNGLNPDRPALDQFRELINGSQ